MKTFCTGLVLAAGVALLNGCAEKILDPESKDMSWYDESKGFDKKRNAQIELLMGQGQDPVQASRNVDNESFLRNTEQDPYRLAPPVDGAELQNVITGGSVETKP